MAAGALDIMTYLDNLTLNRMVLAAQQILAPDRIGFNVHVHLTTGLVRDAILAALDAQDEASE